MAQLVTSLLTQPVVFPISLTFRHGSFLLCVWDLALARSTISDPYFAQICLQPFLFSSPSRLVGRSHALSAASSSCFSLRHSPWSTHLDWFVFWASAGLYFLHQAGGGGFRLISLSGDSVHEQSGNRLVCSALWDIGIKDNIDIKDKNATDFFGSFWPHLTAAGAANSKPGDRGHSLLVLQFGDRLACGHLLGGRGQDRSTARTSGQPAARPRDRTLFWLNQFLTAIWWPPLTQWLLDFSPLPACYVPRKGCFLHKSRRSIVSLIRFQSPSWLTPFK